MTDNTQFPALPDYVGPIDGWFTFLHHEVPMEWTYDVRERIYYIRNHKPSHEVATRLRHILRLPDKFAQTLATELAGAYVTRHARTLNLTAVSEQNALLALRTSNEIEGMFMRQVVKYAKERITGFSWDGWQLLFPIQTL